MHDWAAAGKSGASAALWPRLWRRIKLGRGGEAMQVFNLAKEQAWNPKKHVEKILGVVEAGDASVACWEPGQISPYHCHPRATDIVPGSFVVHPPGELHEYANGPTRTLLFRVRYGADMAAHHLDWRGNPDWTQSAADADYFRRHPPA